MDTVRLTPQNYKEFLPIDIVACSYSYPGAMGDAGAICFIDKEGKSYYLKYCYSPDKWSDEALNEIFPFEDCSPGVFDAGDAPKPWTPYSMGMGNFLYIHESIKEAFDKELQSKDYFLYKDWKEIVNMLIAQN